jgi:hypothetical protein
MVSYDPDKDPFNMQYILSKLGHTGDVDKPRGTFPFVLTKEK